MKTYFAVLVLSFAAGTITASDQIPGKPQQQPIAIVGATIHPVTGPPIPGGTIVFDRGTITALGTSVAIPEGAEVVQAAGKHVYPGLISADTYIGLTEIGAVRASNDRNESGSINPNVRAEAAFNPESELIPVARANGILLAVISPAGGMISGTGAMMMMDGWTWEDMVFQSPAAMYVSWPSMTINRGSFVRRSEEEQKKERDRNLKELADVFRDARAYMKARRAPRIPPHETDVRWEAMIPVLEGRVPVVVRANEVQQIQAAVAWAVQESLRVIISGGHDAWRVADLLRAKNIPVLVGGVHRLPSRRFEPYDEPFVLPKKLHEAGVQFAIMSADEAGHERSMPYQAAQAAAYGLPKDEALKAITLYPARLFGVADRVGSLETGKDATLIVTTSDPLEILCTVEQAFIQGRKVDLTSKHTRLFEKYSEKYRRKGM